MAVILILALVVIIGGCLGPASPSPSPEKTYGLGGVQSSIQPLPINTTDRLAVHFLDVGQGDSILVTYGNKSMLVDGGPQSAGPVVASYLKAHGLSTIDVLVSTHPHADHIGGLLTILNEFPVKRVIDSGQPHGTQTYEQYLTLIDQKNIPYQVGERGQLLRLDPRVNITILSPPASGLGDDLNQNSIVLRIVYGNVSFLLMGDAGTAAEQSLISSGSPLQSDVLKVAHHGSKYASSATFLNEVKPHVSVIEVGQNDYGHPAEATLQRLKDVGSLMYRTDMNGNIVVETNGIDYMVSAQLPAGVAPITLSGDSPLNIAEAAG